MVNLTVNGKMQSYDGDLKVRATKACVTHVPPRAASIRTEDAREHGATGANLALT